MAAIDKGDITRVEEPNMAGIDKGDIPRLEQPNMAAIEKGDNPRLYEKPQRRLIVDKVFVYRSIYIHFYMI